MAFVRLGFAHHADDARAAPRRDLRRRLSDLAIDAQNENGLAASRKAGARKTLGGGNERHANSRRLLERHALRLWHKRFGLDDKMARMGAVAADAEIAGGAEDFRADKLARAVDHGAGKIAARCARKDGVRYHAHRGFQV